MLAMQYQSENLTLELIYINCKIHLAGPFSKHPRISPRDFSTVKQLLMVYHFVRTHDSSVWFLGRPIALFCYLWAVDRCGKICRLPRVSKQKEDHSVVGWNVIPPFILGTTRSDEDFITTRKKGVKWAERWSCKLDGISACLDNFISLCDWLFVLSYCVVCIHTNPFWKSSLEFQKAVIVVIIQSWFCPLVLDAILRW